MRAAAAWDAGAGCVYDCATCEISACNTDRQLVNTWCTTEVVSFKAKALKRLPKAL